MPEGGRETLLVAEEFGEPSRPDVYEAEINKMQKRVLDQHGPYLPDKLSADVVVPVLRGDKPIGFGFLYKREGYADLMRMIDPEEQGKGIGMRLLSQLEHVAEDQGVEEMHSFIADNKPSAQQAMEQAGYKVLRREPGRILYGKRLITQEQIDDAAKTLKDSGLRKITDAIRMGEKHGLTVEKDLDPSILAETAEMIQHKNALERENARRRPWRALEKRRIKNKNIFRKILEKISKGRK